MSQTVIKAEQLGKQYLIGRQQPARYRALRDVVSQGIRDAVTQTGRWLRGQSQARAESAEAFWALQDLHFEVQQGDRVGIIGRNGAGKSTLLKILSRITEPSAGRVEITGRVASLLEVGTGFHPELTGRENIYLNGAIMGMTRAEIRRKFDEMVDFAGVERFLDTPVKRYSTGMYTRLAFSVAAHLEPDILIVDEVLAVGDAEFQRKCLGKMEDVSKKEGRTVLFVSHNMGLISTLCNTCILLNKGRLSAIGENAYVISEYITTENISCAYKKTKNIIPPCFQTIKLKNSKDEEIYEFLHNENIVIEVALEINKEEKRNVTMFIMILDQNKQPICASESMRISQHMSINIPPYFLTRGNFSIHAFIHIPQQTQFDSVYDVCKFKITDAGSLLAIHGSYNYGSVFGPFIWEYEA
ncbi:MAG: polysaccharide ABC transporter ATP-binding protein [Saprospiraceae bacterium]|nr:polysaccharide ABC transporter ATP-binding protein [Saprospiraceae bacterium]